MSETEQESESQQANEPAEQAETEDETETGSSEQAQAQAKGAETEPTQTADSAVEAAEQPDTTAPADVETDNLEVDAHSSIEGVLAIRRTVVSTAGSLIGHKFDGVSEITPTDEGWRAVVEVIERQSIPDTQDVIGRYEITLDEDGMVKGYSRIDRYRRGDTTVFD